jgi:hypothetical protein
MTGNTATPGRTAGGDARPDLAGGNVRQWQNQAGQLANDAQDLRRQLAQSGATQNDLKAVDEVIKSLRSMGAGGGNPDPRGLQQLAGTALDKAKKLDFDLRKRTDTSTDQMFLGGSEEAPPKYKSLVDEYYRNLSKKGGGTPLPAPPKGGGGK